MRRTYTPPPGYDGSRFVAKDGEVRAIEDGDYTLSVGGIPTGKGRAARASEAEERTDIREERSRREERDDADPRRRPRSRYYSGTGRSERDGMMRRGVYSSRANRSGDRSDRDGDHRRDDDRRRNDDRQRRTDAAEGLSDEERIRRTGGRFSPFFDEEEVRTDRADSTCEEEPEACSECRCEAEERCAERECRCAPPPPNECGGDSHRPSFRFSWENGDLLLILLIILLSGEKDSGNLILTLAILLGIR